MVKLLSRKRQHKQRSRSQIAKAKRNSHTQGRKRIAGVTNVFTLKSIQSNWDLKATQQQNYNKLGVITDVNNTIISQHDSLKQYNSSYNNNNNKKNNNSSKDDSTANAQVRGVIADELDSIAAIPPAPKNQLQRMNLTERARIELLILKYGNNYVNMARDITINQNQLTARQLEKRIADYHRIHNNTDDSEYPVLYFPPMKKNKNNKIDTQ